MRKIIKYLFLLLIIFELFTPFINVKADEDPNAEVGDLRCPPQYLNKGCTEILRPINGKTKVSEVVVSVNLGEAKLEKHVKRTDIIGEYEVWFEYEIPSVSESYIVLLFDTSGTNNDNFIKSVDAIQRFSADAISNGHNVALVQFAGYPVSSNTTKGEQENKNNLNANISGNNHQKNFYNISNAPTIKIDGETKKGFPNNYFCGYSDQAREGYGSGADGCGKKEEGWIYSHIEAGFNRANILFSSANVGSNADKIVILFGDGDYKNDDPNKKCNATRSPVATSANYTSWMSKDNIYISARYDGIRGCKCDKYKSTSCNVPTPWRTSLTMQDIAGYGIQKFDKQYFYASKFQSYKDMFKKILDNINNKTSKSTVTDYIGTHFHTNDVETKKWIETLDSKSGKTRRITIHINDGVETGWQHTTNSSFNISYTDRNKTRKSQTYNINPEVYWVKQLNPWQACTDDSNNTRSTTEENLCYGAGEYFCNRFCTENIIGNLEIDSQPKDTHKFNKCERLGFSSNVNLSSNIRCTFSFDEERLIQSQKNNNDELASLQEKLKNETDETKKGEIERDIASVEGKIEELNDVRNKYANIKNQTVNDISRYRDRFININAVLGLNYFDSSKKVISEKSYSNIYETINSNNGTIGCSDEGGGSCSASFSKTMSFKSRCLNGASGLPEECGLSKNQINGGNKFYLDLDNEKIKGANIYVSVSGVGIDQQMTITMEDGTDPACQLNIVECGMPIYRQIKLSDPFLQIQTNKQRKIGFNWNNTSRHFDFTGVIHNDTWEEGYEYQYKLSKVDIETIKKSTGSVNDYLGQSCDYKNSKYICPFVRPSEGSNGSSHYFSEINLNTEKINK